MFDHLLESSWWDDSNKWSNIGFGQEINILEIKLRTLSGALIVPVQRVPSGIFWLGPTLFRKKRTSYTQFQHCKGSATNIPGHVVTRRLTRIQAVWHSDNIFTNFKPHLSTLKIEAYKIFSAWQFICRAKG